MVRGVVERFGGRGAIAAGLAAGSVALIGFGVDSGIEVVAAGALLWRSRRAGAGATDEERGEAERKALYVVAGTFFVLAVYIAVEGVSALASHEKTGTSRLGLGLAIASLVVMPALAWAKQETGRWLGSRALRSDAVETWVCAYLSLALLAGVGLNLAFGWWWADPGRRDRDAAGDRLAGMGDAGGGARTDASRMRRPRRPA